MFGCKTFVKDHGQVILKMDDRSREMIFVDFGVNCYRFWDEKELKFIRSRDAEFVDVQDIRLLVEVDEIRDVVPDDVSKESDDDDDDFLFQINRCTNIF